MRNFYGTLLTQMDLVLDPVIVSHYLGQGAKPA